MKKNQNKNIAIFAFGLMCLIGSYNAVMIKSESLLSSDSPFKRLDEMYGEVKVGRQLAVATDWRKVAPVQKKILKATKVDTASTPVTVVEESTAAISHELDLKLVEVINTKKWDKGVQSSSFSGSIITNNGIIENLTASLPEGLNVDISFSEMTGNTFEYDLNGEIYTGMMYQVDHSSYMITMTNGPLEGTRLRFAGEAQADQAEAYLAETHNVEIGTFGSEIEAPQAEELQDTSTQTAEVSNFNFNI